MRTPLRIKSYHFTAHALVLLAGLLNYSQTILSAANEDPSNLIWLKAPANRFYESTPLGNGRLGAMIFGSINDEKIVINESGMWSGSAQDSDKKDAAQYLPQIKQLLIEGRNVEATKLVNAHFTCAGSGSRSGEYGTYQLLGLLHLTTPNAENLGTIKNYRRELNLSTAVSKITYTQNGINFCRTAFVSAPDQVLVIKISADTPHSISCDLKLDRQENYSVSSPDKSSLLITGQLPD